MIDREFVELRQEFRMDEPAIVVNEDIARVDRSAQLVIESHQRVVAPPPESVKVGEDRITEMIGHGEQRDVIAQRAGACRTERVPVHHRPAGVHMREQNPFRL